MADVVSFGLVWTGDEVTSWLGFADRSGVGGSRGSYDGDWEGELLLLELAGRRGPRERFLVRDHVPLLVPAGRGMAAAACFEGHVPHPVELRFSETGPQIVQSWTVDLDRMTMETVTPDSLDCPDLRARPVGPGSKGAITTPSGRQALGEDDCGDLLDISGVSPVELPYRSPGGCMIDGDDPGDDIALSVVEDRTGQPGEGWIQLEAFLAWDFTGAPLWRVLDTEAIGDLDAISLECWTADGTPAVATVEGPTTDPTPVAAWSTSQDRLELTSVDPSTVTCVYLGGGATFRRLVGRMTPGREQLAQGVNVEVGKKEAAIDLVVVVQYGYPIPALAQQVRENVIARVESDTGLSVKEVNIEVDDLQFEQPESEGARRVE